MRIRGNPARTSRGSAFSLRAPARLARIALSLGVLALFLVGFFSGGAVASGAMDLLTRFQVIPSFLRSVVTGAGALTAGFAVVLVVTLLFGRVYCSSLCPLGTVQDLFIAASGRTRRRAFRYRAPLWLVRLAVLALLVAAAVLGSTALINLLDPYAFFGRITRDMVTPVIVVVTHGVSAAARLFDLFLAPIGLPVDVPAMAVTLITFAALGWASLRYGRAFCNVLCPVGTVLALIGSRSLLGVRIDPEKCTSCGRCESVCKAGCASSNGKRIDAGNCVSCFDCLDVCPFDALHYGTRGGIAGRRGVTNAGAQGAKAGRGAGEGVSRRGFLRRMTAAAGGATAGRVTFRGAAGGAILPAVFPVSFLLRKRATGPEGRENEPATPPGSHSREHFTSRCVACHLCVSRCPTNVLQPSVFEYGIAGLMQPVMDYSSGFCEYECNVCSQVCPTGAILPVTLEHKKLISIGTVQFIEDRCVVFTDGTACGACAEVCPTEAVHMIPYRGHVTQPETDIDICIGCGNCEYACPVEGGKAIYVEGKQVHELREERAPITEPAGGGRAARGAADEARARQTERGADDVRAPQPDRGAGPARDGAAADGGGGGAPGGPEPESLPGPGEEPWPF